MNVSGRNLAMLCKLIYKVSKNEASDHLFDECHFLGKFPFISTQTPLWCICSVEVLFLTMRSMVLAEIFVDKFSMLTLRLHADALMYSIATIKFLSSNDVVLQPLAKTRIVDILTDKITLVNDEVRPYYIKYLRYKSHLYKTG